MLPMSVPEQLKEWLLCMETEEVKSKKKELRARIVKIILRGPLDLHVEIFVRRSCMSDAKEKGQGKEVKLRAVITGSVGKARVKISYPKQVKKK